MTSGEYQLQNFLLSGFLFPVEHCQHQHISNTSQLFYHALPQYSFLTFQLSLYIAQFQWNLLEVIQLDQSKLSANKQFISIAMLLVPPCKHQHPHEKAPLTPDIMKFQDYSLQEMEDNKNESFCIYFVFYTNGRKENIMCLFFLGINMFLQHQVS